MRIAYLYLSREPLARGGEADQSPLGGVLGLAATADSWGMAHNCSCLLLAALLSLQLLSPARVDIHSSPAQKATAKSQIMCISLKFSMKD